MYFILEQAIGINILSEFLSEINFYYLTFESTVTKQIIMSKGKDSKKNVKKAPTKTAKEKKAEKRLKKSKS